MNANSIPQLLATSIHRIGCMNTMNIYQRIPASKLIFNEGNHIY